ncbi:MFS transporter [Pelagovum pacificum]|nr:MFS transporter [Pelagovum pacificum]QQA43487.1 MFS transporter [Pelagovum pacificum]
MFAFAIHGATLGALVSRLPELQRGLALSEGAFGLALLAMSVGVFLGNIVVAPFIERWGARTACIVSAILFACLTVPTALTTGLVTLSAALFLFGLALSSGNVSINVAGTAIERRHESSIMNRLHGSWGIGFLVATMIAPLLIAAGVSPLAQFVGAAVILSGLAIVMLAPMSDPESAAESVLKKKRFAVPSSAVWMVALAAMAGGVLEGIARNWSVIYLRDTLDAAEAVAAVALPVFTVMLTLGRLSGDWAVTRFGAVRVGQGASVLLLAGVLLLAAASSPVVAMVALGLVGAGTSVAIPLGFSACGRIDGGSATTLAAYSLLSTIMNSSGSPIYGLLAQVTDLRMALLFFVPIIVLSLLMSGRFGRQESDDLQPA